MAKNDYNDESKSGRIRQSIKEKKNHGKIPFGLNSPYHSKL